MHTRIGLPQLTREGGVVPSLHIQHMLHMRSALDSPDDDKETDPTVERLVTELVQQCQEVCDKYGEDVSMALAQDEVDPSVHAPGAQQPLHIKREATKKYAKHWAGLIVMLLRLFRHESGGGTDGAAHHLAFLCENKVYLDHRATLRSLDRHIARRRRLELCSGAERQALVDALGLLSVAIVEEEVRGKAREETGLLLLYSSIRGIHVQKFFSDVITLSSITIGFAENGATNQLESTCRRGSGPTERSQLHVVSGRRGRTRMGRATRRHRVRKDS